MTEYQYQNEFLDFIITKKNDSIFIPNFKMRFDEMKQHRFKDYSMPDFFIDIIEFDKEQQFHLWELKLLENNELWNGKFFGQILAYDYLFSTQSVISTLKTINRNIKTSDTIRGDVNKLKSFLENKAKEEKKIKDTITLEFKSWNLLVCGNTDDDYNPGETPILWSYWVLGDTYFRDEKPHFIENKKSFLINPFF